MFKYIHFIIGFLSVFLPQLSCGQDIRITSKASLGRIGNQHDIHTATVQATVLIGGGGNVDDAFRWMIDRSGGGDVVVLTASGTTSYTSEIFELGGVNSVETLHIDSRELAENDTVANIIRNAEMLFIGGGDQSRYMNYWKGTKTHEAINYLLNEKKVPVGGTSAGCAILSGIYYSGENGSVKSEEALNNPYHERITLYNNDFLEAPFLTSVISDQHYTQRGREGRHVTFLARALADWKSIAYGIAPDERTAVCIDQYGIGRVIGEGDAYFIKPVFSERPEHIVEEKPLDWSKQEQALHVYRLSAAADGLFDVSSFSEESARGGKWHWWYVDQGKLLKVEDVRDKKDYVLVVHGGAGTILRKNMTDEQERQYCSALKQALMAGYTVLEANGSSLDAVEAAVRILEDNPLFNAGKGAVFTNDGRNELDASIMDGRTLKAGAVAGVTTIRNPIHAARVVMEQSEHVMMVGSGAEQFAAQNHVEIVDPSYFSTKNRWEGLQKAREQDSLKSLLDHNSSLNDSITTFKDYKYGTVGAVAVDRQGNLAAATSTGGMTNKRYGRIGDSPIIGAGTYADNATVAVSCTGWGEFYIRSVAAYDVAALMAYRGLGVNHAASTVIAKIGELGGDGGMIAIDKDGNIAMPFNTEGMYRGAIRKDGTMEVYIYK